jgi:hypothetical protein
MEKVSQFELDSFLEEYKNISTKEVIKFKRMFKFVLFIYHKTTLFILFWLVTMAPSFVIMYFSGLNSFTAAVATVMFVIYPILFFIYQKTIFSTVEAENEYFQRKVQKFEYIIQNRKGA